VSDSQETHKAESPLPSGELAVESILTTHRILETFGRDPRSFDILHGDLFDSRTPVVLSALQAVSAIADGRSLAYVARLFSHADAQIVCAAVRAAGALGAAEAFPLLVQLARSTRQEAVQLEVLQALANGFPKAPETLEIAANLSRSVSAQAETVAAARLALFQLESLGGAAISQDLAENQPDVLPFLFQLARKDEKLALALLNRFRSSHAGLSLDLRGSLIALSAPFSSDAARSIFLDSLRDDTIAIRRACYRQIGNHPTQVPHFDSLCQALLGGFEQQASMEEEALEALDAMQSTWQTARTRPDLPSLRGLPALMKDLFDKVVRAIQPDVDVTHETGMQIASAKEYVEFYFNDDDKRTFINSMKSGSGLTLRRSSAKILKDSAVRLEQRHFEGYNIMFSLVADPGRPGMPLFLRHLAAADTGKRGTLCRLKRALLLARLVPSMDTISLLRSILEWASAQKMFRLAELALLALRRADPVSALAAARRYMTSPVKTKVLAIASLDFLENMDPAAVELVLIGLLQENDRYLRVALLESLASLPAQSGTSLLTALLHAFGAESDSEVCSKIADLLGARGDEGVAHGIAELFDKLEEWKKPLAISLLGRIARRAGLQDTTRLTEFVYRTLRTGSPPVLARVPTALMALEDDLAPNVLRDVLPRLGPRDRAALVRDLRDELHPAVIAVVWSLLRERDPGLQQVLREILPLTTDPRAQQLLVSMVRTLRTRVNEAEPLEVEPVETEAGVARTAGFSSEKETYRFEREHIRSCAVLFSDIEGYSAKAQELSAIELSVLLRQYEGMLIPITEAHGGTLIKRMGDGHLFVFEECMDSVLAAIRVQKALRRYNRFHPEAQRVQVRIGIHWGEVVQRETDVLGNTVNIASRLQSAAKGGSTCISQEVYEAVSEWIHANDLGQLQVKGLREPVQAWEPTEAALGMPARLDPLKRKGGADTTSRKEAALDVSALDAGKLAAGLSQVFQRLLDVSRKSARAGEESAIEEEFARAWTSLQALISALEKPSDEDPPEPGV